MGTRIRFPHPLPLPLSDDLLLVLAQIFQPVPRDVEVQDLPVLEQLGAAEDAAVGDPLRQVLLCASDERVHEICVHLMREGSSKVKF